MSKDDSKLEDQKDSPVKRKRDKYNILISNIIYPDAESLFKFQLAPLEEIKNDCLVVVDTNVLLLPYTVNQKSLEEIRKMYAQLIASKRLVIPGQVAREFARNRATKIAELYQQLSRKRDAQGLPRLESYPLLQSMSVFNEALDLSAEIENLTKELRKKLNEVLDRIKEWVWNDPVSLMYRELFVGDVIIDPAVSTDTQDEIELDLDNRINHGIPPGYKDSAKADKGVGDLLIWRTILDVGKRNKKSVIFVSGEEKADWWYQSEKVHLYPRYELVDEFRRASEQQSFYILAFSRFLELFNASQEVVDEIRKEEIQWTSEIVEYSITEKMDAALAVLRWLTKEYPYLEMGHDESRKFDLFISERGGATIGVEVIAFRDAHRRIRLYEELFREIEGKLEKSNFDNLMLVLVGINEEAGYALTNSVQRIKNIPFSEIICGYLTSDKEYIPLFKHS